MDIVQIFNCVRLFVCVFNKYYTAEHYHMLNDCEQSNWGVSSVDVNEKASKCSCGVIFHFPFSTTTSFVLQLWVPAKYSIYMIQQRF